MLSSIQESFEKQVREQGETIRSSENRYYLGILNWSVTDEGDLFWNILFYSYSIYGKYDYETIIKLFSRFQCMPDRYISIHDIYTMYFDKEKGTLTSDGFEYLIKYLC